MVSPMVSPGIFLILLLSITQNYSLSLSVFNSIFSVCHKGAVGGLRSGEWVSA